MKPKVIGVHTYREFCEAGVKPYRSAKNPWNYLLYRSDGLFGFSLNKTEPTTWTEPCENGCQDGWHKAECIKAFRQKMNAN